MARPLDPFDGVDLLLRPATAPRCSGIIAAEDNGFGVTGIVARCGRSGWSTPSPPSPARSWPQRSTWLRRTAPRATSILIEQQLCPVTIVGGNVCAPGWLPVEWFPSYYDAIVAAVNKDLHVVQAGRQRWLVTSTPSWSSPTPARSSSAPATLLAAACLLPAQRRRTGGSAFSNHGERVDLQSHGAMRVDQPGVKVAAPNPDDSLLVHRRIHRHVERGGDRGRCRRVGGRRLPKPQWHSGASRRSCALCSEPPGTPQDTSLDGAAHRPATRTCGRRSTPLLAGPVDGTRQRRRRRRHAC